MPTTTGTSTTAITSATLPNCSGTTCPVLAKVAMAQLAISGMVTMDSSVLMAVSEMFIATLPPNRWLNRLADTPPGEAASSIRPTAYTRRQAEAHDDGVAGRGQQHGLQQQRHHHSLGVVAQAPEVGHAQRQAQAEHHQRQRRPAAAPEPVG